MKGLHFEEAVTAVGHVLRGSRRAARSRDHGVEEADIQRLGEPTRELGRGQDRSGQPYAPRVKELLGDALSPSSQGLKQVHALVEKRALLGELELERRDVLDDLVGLDLAEVRVDGGVEEEAACHRPLEVEPDIEDAVEEAGLRASRVGVLRPQNEPACGERGQLEAPLWVEPDETGEVSEPRYDARPFRGNGTDAITSWLRPISRRTAKPHTCSSTSG